MHHVAVATTLTTTGAAPATRILEGIQPCENSTSQEGEEVVAQSTQCVPEPALAGRWKLWRSERGEKKGMLFEESWESCFRWF